jgi:hypothetical protein
MTRVKNKPFDDETRLLAAVVLQLGGIVEVDIQSIAAVEELTISPQREGTVIISIDREGQGDENSG